MFKFAATLSLVLATALAAPQLDIHNQQRPQQAQVYQQQAQAYQTSGAAGAAAATGSQTTPVPIISFDDSQPGDGTFKYR